MTLGNKIKEIRKRKNITQSALCQGKITRNMLSLIENGVSLPSLASLVYLAEKLGAEFYPELVTARWDEAAGKITLTCDEGDFLRTYEPGGKALCSLGDGEAGYLRLFPLKARMEAKKREFIRVEPDCADAEHQTDVILRTEKIDNNCNFIEYRSAEETAQMLINIMKGEAGHEG